MGIFDAVGSLLGFGGGGGSSSASVTSNVNLTVNGLDNLKFSTPDPGIKVNSTTEVKPLSLELKPIELKPIELKPLELKPVTFNENIDLKPVELKPVTFNENIDLKPVAVDTCQTLRLAPLPETEVCQPYRHHVGYTVFGMEVSGVTYEGESQQLIQSPHRPQVVDRRPMSRRRPPPPGPAVTEARSQGIRVRVLDPDDED